MLSRSPPRSTRIALALSLPLLAVGALLATSRASAQDEPKPEEAAETAEPDEAPECTWDVVAKGEGEVCGNGRAAVVHYVGTLLDGKKFDSSRDRGRPFTFEVGAGGVIKGWDLVVAQMRVGDRWNVTIPWQLAYGETGSPPAIPGKSDLVFDIELLAVTDIETEVLAQGEGRALKMGDFVEAHIQLKIVDGETLTDTRAKGETAPFSVGRPTGIAGLDMAVRRMHIGDRWKITIPPELAFGERGAPPRIAPNAVVVADVEVLRILEPKIETLTEGEGATPTRGQRVNVHYIGTFTNGDKFDSSRDRDQPFSFVLGAGQVIPGWDIAVSRMRVGQRATVTIPWQLAYGPNGRPPMIPAKSDLVFDMELLSIE